MPKIIMPSSNLAPVNLRYSAAMRFMRLPAAISEVESGRQSTPLLNAIRASLLNSGIIDTLNVDFHVLDLDENTPYSISENGIAVGPFTTVTLVKNSDLADLEVFRGMFGRDVDVYHNPYKNTILIHREKSDSTKELMAAAGIGLVWPKQVFKIISVKSITSNLVVIEVAENG